MANRSYLYSLSNRPTSYADRPETISGLSEWPYAVPFSYRVLMSEDPRLGASLITDGFADEPPDRKTQIHAISSDFEVGFARLKKFLSIVRPLAVGTSSSDLVTQLDETLVFLEAHRDRYLLLETIEVDSMTEATEAALRACVEREINACRRAGAAVDALPANVTEAGARLRAATQGPSEGPLDAFRGLRLDDDFDNTRDDRTEYPVGLSGWSDALYFQLWNRAQFEAER